MGSVRLGCVRRRSFASGSRGRNASPGGVASPRPAAACPAAGAYLGLAAALRLTRPLLFMGGLPPGVAALPATALPAAARWAAAHPAVAPGLAL